MSDGRIPFYGEEEYARILSMAKAGDPVLLDGFPCVIVSVEFEGGQWNRGYYRVHDVRADRPLASLAVLANGIGG
jgi:hypothetical protein